MNTMNQVDELITRMKTDGLSKQEIVWKTALACVDWPYVYSSWGDPCTPSERRKRYKLTKKEPIKAKCKAYDSGDCSGCKWYPGGERVRCYDCRGFTDWCLKQIGFDLYGDTCSTQWSHAANWKAKGTIDSMPKGILCCLFVYKSGKWQHTGFGLNDETCECGNNVQYSAKRAAKWTHWAVPAGLDGEIPDPQPEPTPTPGKRPTLRQGDRGVYVVELQTDLVKLGYGIGPCGIDGVYGRSTKAAVETFQYDHKLVIDGICGPKTYEAIDQALEDQDHQPEPVVSYAVVIKDLSLEEAKQICEAYPTAEIVEGSVSR